MNIFLHQANIFEHQLYICLHQNNICLPPTNIFYTRKKVYLYTRQIFLCTWQIYFPASVSCTPRMIRNHESLNIEIFIHVPDCINIIVIIIITTMKVNMIVCLISSPLIICWGDSVIVCDHVGENCYDAFFRVQPCHLGFCRHANHWSLWLPLQSLWSLKSL